MWCSQMIENEQKREFELYRDLVEYLASFSNPEAVAKIKEARKSAEEHNFMDDETFEQSIKDGSFKNNEWIKRLQKIKADANLSDDNS